MEYKQSATIYNSRNVLLEQLTQLGYDTTPYTNFSISEINAMFNSKQLDMLIHHHTGATKIYVRYVIDTKTTESTIDTLCSDLFEINDKTEEEPTLTTNDTIIVLFQHDNDNITNKLKTIWEQSGYYIVPNTIPRLQFNVLKHSLVPPHRILKPDEIEPLFRKYNISSTDQLPKISRFDPVAIAICIKPGEICEIIRTSKNAIQSKYYRICVNMDFNYVIK
jgi:DNA-directed RNA polymerase subunit H (RpoH/RPB5)